jgi:hypothetical protein
MAGFATPCGRYMWIGFASLGKVSIRELDIYPDRLIQHHPGLATELHGVLDGGRRYADATEYIFNC